MSGTGMRLAIFAEMTRQDVTTKELASRLGLLEPYVVNRLGGRGPLTGTEVSSIEAALGVPAGQMGG